MSLREVFQAELQRTVPADLTVVHFLGALTLVLLALQVVTGVLLMAYYRPSPDAAYLSIGIISDEVRLGWLVRSLHRWSADFLIILATLHLVRVYFAQAYQMPRQLGWTSGILLGLVILGFDFTGALLPWNQHAYWSTDAIRETITGVPVLGHLLLELFWGGEGISGDTLLRFYSFHVGLLPWIAVVIVAVHLRVIWSFGITEPARLRHRTSAGTVSFFPDFVLDLLIAFLLTFAVLISMAILFPPHITERADPLSPLGHVDHRWYLIPIHQVLQQVSHGIGALLVILALALVFAVPAFDPGPIRSARARVVRWMIGSLVIAGAVALGIKGYLS